jgi:hypothetical protein
MIGILSSHRFLAIYSGCLTLTFAITMLCGFETVEQAKDFDIINVHRINIVEPDGTIRMVLTSKDRAPGAYVKNKEYPHATRKSAGLFFFDDEGTEDGGLIYGVTRDANGKIAGSYGHLSFDKYMQDQIFTVDSGREGQQDYSLLSMEDRGDYSVMDAIAANERISKLPQDQRATEWAKFKAAHPGDADRVLLGRAPDGSSVLKLKDGEGRDRIVIRVARDGTPNLQILSADGKVIDELPRATEPSPTNR